MVYEKGKGLDHRAEPSRLKLCWVHPPPEVPVMTEHRKVHSVCFNWHTKIDWFVRKNPLIYSVDFRAALAWMNITIFSFVHFKIPYSGFMEWTFSFQGSQLDQNKIPKTGPDPLWLEEKKYFWKNDLGWKCDVMSVRNDILNCNLCNIWNKNSRILKDD